MQDNHIGLRNMFCWCLCGFVHAAPLFYILNFLFYMRSTGLQKSVGNRPATQICGGIEASYINCILYHYLSHLLSWGEKYQHCCRFRTQDQLQFEGRFSSLKYEAGIFKLMKVFNFQRANQLPNHTCLVQFTICQESESFTLQRNNRFVSMQCGSWRAVRILVGV